MQNAEYQRLIAQEGETWGNLYSDFAQKVRPDWQYIRHTPGHAILYTHKVKQLLAMIKPTWKILEIGCATGWLSLEMARQGADVTGLDVSERSIEIAQAYARENPPSGNVTYHVADINYAPIEVNHYDLIVCFGVLHHLVEVEAVLDRIHQGLTANGILFISDTLEETPRINALLGGGLSFLLPTQVSYMDKWRALLKVRGGVLKTVTSSIEAHGLSPFEGYGRQFQPETLIPQKFTVSQMTTNHAFAAYVVGNLRMPERLALAIGRVLSVIDDALIRLHVVRGLTYTMIAHR